MNLNKLKSFFSKTFNIGSASTFLLLIFIAIFLLGWFYGSLDFSATELNLLQKTILTSLLPTLIAITTALTKFIVNAEATRLSAEKISKKDSEIEAREIRIGELQKLYRQRMEVVQNIKAFIDSHQNYINTNNLRSLQAELASEIEKIEREGKATTSLVSWLSNDENKMILMKYSFQEAMRINPINYFENKESITAFRQDLFRCIVWFQESLIGGAPYRVNTSDLVHALTLPKGIDNYKTAIRAMERHPDIIQNSQGTYQFKRLVDHLITKLTRELRQY